MLKLKLKLNYLVCCLMCGCVQCDVSVWSHKRKNECIDHREKDWKLDSESQMDEDAQLWNLVALFCE